MELPHMDIDADAGASSVPHTIMSVGVQFEETIEVPVDQDPNKLVQPEYSLVVKPAVVDAEAFYQQALAQVLGIVCSAENQPADDLQTATSTWTIENWSHIGHRGPIISDSFVVGGYKWRFLLLFGADRCCSPHLSVGLGIADSAQLPLGWSRFASVTLDVVNQLDPELTLKKRVINKHRFNQDSTDVGIYDFLPMADLHDRDRGFLVNKTLIIQTVVDMRKVAPYLPADSRKETGFVGLKNQGATCYLNSIIQTLYHLPVLRKVVYHMPTGDHDVLSESISLALQSLFYKLQYSDTSPGTEDLTKSFGWDQSKCLMEGDSHQFNLFLRDKLEEEMRGTPVEGTIQKLFEGHQITYGKFLEVSSTSTHMESFYELQLYVQGCKDVYASLDKYVEVKELAIGHEHSTGLVGFEHAARIEAKFIDFPPILQLRLKRVVYDSNQDEMVKIHDRYEFPLQLDLDRENGMYLFTDADRSVRNLYTLQSILVHSGSCAEGGHYYALIRPTLSDQWYKFDDERVTKEESETVLEEHCGSDEDENHPGAYMLLYIRESQKEVMLCPVEQEDIPAHLRVSFKEEEEEEAERLKRDETKAMSLESELKKLPAEQ